MKTTLAFVMVLLLSLSARSQNLSPRKWSFFENRNTETIHLFKDVMPTNQYVYLPGIRNEVYQKADFTYFPHSALQPIKSPTELNQITKFDQTFDAHKGYYDKASIVQQKIKLGGKMVVKGSIELIPCNDLEYFLPETTGAAFRIN